MLKARWRSTIHAGRQCFIWPTAAESFAAKRIMHLIEFREIVRDAEVAHAIQPIVRKYNLAVADTTIALTECGVARARNVAEIAAKGAR